MKRVSYIAVTLDRAKFIEPALANWRELKTPDDELIVVDGNSKDGTYEILQKYEGGLVDTLIHEPDRCEAHAFNKGFLVARGQLIKLLTDDDYFYKDALEQAYRVMFEHPEIDVLNTGGENVLVEADGSHRLVDFQYARESPNPYWRLQCGLGLIIRRKSLALTGLIDVRHRWSDTTFLLQAMHAGANVKFLQVKGFKHARHAGSVTTRHMSKQRREFAEILRDRSAPLTYRLLGVYDPLWYVRNPAKATRRILDAVQNRIAKPPPTEPVWDGKIY